MLSVLEELCREYGEAAVFSGDPAYQVEVYAPSLHQSALPITTLDEAARPLHPRASLARLSLSPVSRYLLRRFFAGRFRLDSR